MTFQGADGIVHIVRTHRLWRREIERFAEELAVPDSLPPSP
ncbi:MAG: hypothetical protein WD739_06575 [Actinomycetota bacterium]